MGFSPLCGPCGAAAHMQLITGELVTKIGKAHGKSGAQVSLHAPALQPAGKTRFGSGSSVAVCWPVPHSTLYAARMYEAASNSSHPRSTLKILLETMGNMSSHRNTKAE